MIGKMSELEYWNRAKEISSSNKILLEIPRTEELFDVIFSDDSVTFNDEVSGYKELRGLYENKEYRIRVNHHYESINPHLFLGAICTK